MNSEVYCVQLDRVVGKLSEIERKEPVIFLHDNATPHTSKMTKKKLADIGWEVLPHPPYSPDIAPSDYHLFRSFKGWLKGKRYDDIDELKAGIQEFFDSKPAQFYQRGIYNLLDRWDQIITYEGDYCD